MKKMISDAQTDCFSLTPAASASVLAPRPVLAPSFPCGVELAAVLPGIVVIIAAPMQSVRDAAPALGSGTSLLMRRRGDGVQANRARRSVFDSRSVLDVVTRMPAKADHDAAARAAVSLYTGLAARRERDAQAAEFAHVDLRA